MSAPPLSNQRAIVDRRKLAQTIGETIGEADGDGRSARDAVLTLLRKALENGRTELSRRLAEHPSAGHAQCGGQSFLIDRLART